MIDKFSSQVIKELNKFRNNPQSIIHQIDLIRKGFSRLRANDPFLTEIDYFINNLKSMPSLPSVEFNEVLSEAAKKQLPNFRGKPSFQKYRRTDGLNNIVPDYYMVASPAMTADDGAEEPINVLTKILLDKQDRYKEGRDILCNKNYTQVGIAHEVFDDENMVIMIFATQFVEDEPEYELPEGDLSELKKAFDCLDVEGKQVLDMKELMRNLDDMEFNKTDPTLYSIFKELSDKKRCSWPKFAYYANARMTDRSTKKGLLTIFNLFIDNPEKNTITFQTFKKICNEIECGLSEQQLKDIMEAATANGNEITYKEFEDYMAAGED